MTASHQTASATPTSSGSTDPMTGAAPVTGAIPTTTGSATANGPATDVEAIEDSLSARYGDAAPDASDAINDVIALQLQHRSVRRFTEQDVDDDAITAIIAAAQSASTSSNMQSWSVIEIRDPAHKAAVSELSGNQAFIRQAPVFLVFIADWARNRAVAKHHDGPSVGIDYMESTLVGFVDAAIAAQNAAIAAESLGLGITYVGSVRNSPEAMSDLLQLPAGAFPVAGLVIGHPDPADTASVKPRLPQTVVRHRETYAASATSAIDAYDNTVSAYYASQGRGRAWSPSVLDRVRDEASLHGRHVMRDALHKRGLPSK